MDPALEIMAASGICGEIFFKKAADMKLLSFVLSGVLALSMTLMGVDAQAAKRFGGGQSVGKQSSQVTQREGGNPNTAASPAIPAATTNNSGSIASAGVAAKSVAPALGAAAASKKPWGAMLGGLAAGLGLAWLASSLGFGEAFGQFMLFALLALVVMIAFGWWMHRKRSQLSLAPGRGTFAMAGAAPAGIQTPREYREYRPENVGNDASARPWERNSMAFDPSKVQPSPASHYGSRAGVAGSTQWSVPSGFDDRAFLATAKHAFVGLQAAWDVNDVKTLRDMMTDQMLSEIRQQLAEREQHTGGLKNHTEVVALDAKLLGVEDTGNAWMASVEFSGMIKEDPSQSPGPFREVWNMTKPKDGSAGWLVAGLQALN